MNFAHKQDAGVHLDRSGKPWQKVGIVEEQEGQFTLFCRYSDGFTSDTCHFSLEEAKVQAAHDFGVVDTD